MFGLINAKVAIKWEESQTRLSYPEREQARPKVNARLYDPYLGRYLSPDPVYNITGGPLDHNPYVFSKNNPSNVVK